MRYRIVAKVEGQVLLTEPTSMIRGPISIEFRRDVNNKLYEIAATIAVPREKESAVAATIQPVEGPANLKITLWGDKELHDALVSEMQLLESDLAFATLGALRRIHWEDPTSIETLKDGEQNEPAGDITSYSFTRAYPDPRFVLNATILNSVLTGAPRSPSLRTAKAFWRDGYEYFRQFKYIQAFYAFYFVMEDFYAHGKTGEQATLREFSKSPELRPFAEKALLETMKDDRHRLNLVSAFQEEGLESNADGLLNLLFRVRGRLHHYSSRSSKRQPTPFNQGHFETFALVASFITTSAIEFRDRRLRRQARAAPAPPTVPSAS